MADSQAQPEQKAGGIYNGGWLILFLPLFIGLYFIAQMYWVTEPMAASRLSFGVLSRVDFFGFVILALAFSNLLAIRGLAGVASFSLTGALGLGLLYFSYFGAMDYSASHGPDLFWESVVSEQGCFPEKWIPVAEAEGLAVPAEEDLCSHSG